MSAALMQSSVAYRVDAAPATQPMRIRLTRRGRVVLGLLGVIGAASLLAVTAALFAPQAVASNSSDGPSFGYVVAAPGASLWQLATELDAKADPRDLVAEIVQLNQLQGSEVQVGQAIAVPLRYSDSPAVFTADEVGLSPEA